MVLIIREIFSPMTAAEIAKSFGIRVYTIGVGTGMEWPLILIRWGILYNIVSIADEEIDEKTFDRDCRNNGW